MITQRFFGKSLSLYTALLFILNLYYQGKLVEFISFVVWELKYRLGLYPRSNFVRFNSNKAKIVLSDLDSAISSFAENNFSECKNTWRFVSKIDEKYFLGFTIQEPNVLVLFDENEAIQNRYAFNDPIESLYVTKSDIIFVCLKGVIYKSNTIPLDFKEVLQLSTDKSFFLYETITENPSGTIFIGEYGNVTQGKGWLFLGYVYFSDDNGETWGKSDFLKRSGVNKHVHLLKWSTVVNGLILTDGDNTKGIWINKSTNYDSISDNEHAGWKRINKYHFQKGGYTALIESEGSILLGTDYYGGTNFLASTNDMKKFIFKVNGYTHT